MKNPKTFTQWSHCTRCHLHRTAHRIVVGEGNIHADVVFIGEAPGKAENNLGRPFIGRSGKILRTMLDDLRHMLEESSNVPPFTYYITNIIACIPWENDQADTTFRKPTEEEAFLCRPRIDMILEKTQPKLVVLLGKVAEEFFRPGSNGLGFTTLPLYHPSYIARQGGVKTLLYKKERDKLLEAIERIL